MSVSRLGFREKLLLGAVLPALIMVALLEMIFLNRYQADLEQTFQERSRAIARQLGPAVEYALFTGSRDTLQVLADATRESDPGVLSVSVLGRDGQLLGHAGTPLRDGLALGPELQMVEGPGYMTVIAPVMQTPLPLEGDDSAWGSRLAAKPELSGYVVVEISRRELDDRRREMIQITVMIMLGGFLFASWLSMRIADGVMGQLDAASAELRRQKEVAETLARTDTLTGLLNRRAFDEFAKHEIQRALRYDSALALVMTDLDHFKAINDTHGHEVGDHVLIDFAQVLRNSVREVDRVGRWGGEEFVVLMPGAGIEEAMLAAERMRLAVAGAPTRVDGRTCGYTASFGVAALSPEGPTLEALLHRADTALYRAKDNGRNRVELG